MRASLLALALLAGCSCSDSVARSAAVLESSVKTFADASAPAFGVAGVTTASWEGLRDATLDHAAELRARANGQ